MAKDFHKIQKGLSIVPRAAPASPEDGDVWYDVALGKFQKREGGSTTDLGAGAGSGTNRAFQQMAARLQSSIFGRLGHSVFAVDGITKVGSATAVYDSASTEYDFTAGQHVTSVQLLSTDFLAQGRSLSQAEFLAIWKPGALNAGATYELSRNGGTSWQAVTVSQLGTDTVRGVHQFTVEADQVIHEIPVVNADSTNSFNPGSSRKGQQFVVTQTELVRGFTAYFNKLGAATGGSFRVLLMNDSAGLPGTTSYASSAPVDIAALATGNIAVNVTIPDTVLVPGTYWWVIQVDAVYISDPAVGYSAGVRDLAARMSSTNVPPNSAFYNTSWAVNTLSGITYQMKGIVLDLRARITASGAGSLEGFGVLFDFADAMRTTGLPIERKVQLANTTAASFTLTKFAPDPDLLEVICDGKIYVYGDFQLQGQTVIFPDETFLSASDLALTFRQLRGVAFDSSDRNAQLLAANFLGSTDATIDRSQNGRGIFVKRPDGVMREITIDNNDQIAVYSV